MKTSLSAWLLIVGLLMSSVYLGVYWIERDNALPSVLRMGVLPDEDPEALSRRYQPLLEYLSSETGLEFEMVVPSDYAKLLQLFGDNALDLAYFGGFTFVQANLFYQAEALVMRDVDARFTSLFVARHDAVGQSVADFEGKAFSFSSRLSTSGHLMPRYFLKSERQIIPERYFSSVIYSGTHDKTAYLARDGEVDLGVVNSEIIRTMLNDGRLKKNELRMVWETPPYPNYVWSVQQGLDDRLKNRLRDAFLGISESREGHARILERIGAGSFLPAGTGDFEPLKRVAESLGMLTPAAR